VNIGPEERRKRRVMGTWTLALALALAGTAVVLGWGVGARLVLAPLVFAGFLGILQAREHTCVALASKGLCDLDAGPQRVQDDVQRRALKAKAWRLMAKCGAATAAVLAVVLLLP
jgi:hypothetical protein